MDCCSTILKYLVFLFNFIFFLCGCTIIGAGAYLYIEVNTYHEFFGKSYLGGPIVLIVVGVLIALVTFFGCCGAITENSCLMFAFGVSMALILIAEIGVAIAILVFKADALGIVTTEMARTQENYGQLDQMTKVWDEVQRDFSCCGVSNYTDWKNIDWSRGVNVPDSCCNDDHQTGGCGKGMIVNPDAREYIFTEGCLNKFVDAVEDHAALAGGIAAGLGVLQLVIVVVSFCLGRRMREERSYA